MKKSLKILATGLAVIPCAIALTACGAPVSEHELVNTTGNYSAASSYSEVNEYVAENGAEASTELDSYKLIIENEYTTTMGDISSTSNIRSEIIFQIDEDGNVNAHISIKSGGNADLSMDAYVKDGLLYQDSLLGGWISFGEYLDNAEIATRLASCPTLENLFAGLESATLDGLTIEKAETATSTKFKIALTSEVLASFLADTEAAENLNGEARFDSDAVAYFVFENDEFVGSTIDVSFSADIEGLMTISTEYSVEYAKYEGTINFPDFNN